MYEIDRLESPEHPRCNLQLIVLLQFCFTSVSEEQGPLKIQTLANREL